MGAKWTPSFITYVLFVIFKIICRFSAGVFVTMPERTDAQLPALPQPDGEPTPPRVPLIPGRSDFLEGDAPAADKVQAFLSGALEAISSEANTIAGALVPWICDALLSNHSVKAFGRDLMDFLRHMQAQ